MNKRDVGNSLLRRKPLLIETVLVIALVFTTAVPAHSQNRNAGVVPPQANAHGNTYGEWSALWWNWFFRLEFNQNHPLNWQNTCSTGQVGSVWFLVGFIPGPRTINCDIPTGKALFFPIINAECSNLEPFPYFGATPEQRHECAVNDMIGVTSMTATIDGVALQDLTKYRAASPDFDFTVPPNNILGVPAGSGKASADGYYLMLVPLSKGTHTIHFTASIVNPFVGSFTVDTTYILTVGK